MNIVYFAPIAFDDLKQRPQYIAEKLAEKHNVVYVEPTIRWISYVSGRAKEYRGKTVKVSEHLTVVRCNGMFVIPFRWKIYDIFSLNSFVEEAYLKNYMDQADIIIVAYEGWADVLRHVHGKKIIYDKMDDNVLLTPEKSLKYYLKKMENELLTHCTCMIASAQKFVDDYKDKVKWVVHVPNGVDITMNETNIQPNPKKTYRVYGYVGMISEWFDMDALKTIANQDDVKVFMVGPCKTKKYEKENIFYEGRVPKTEVGEKIQTFDVCLYPFKQGDLLDTINPVKIYEYLAYNKPVIAVDSRETRNFGNLIYRYNNIDELKTLCNSELKKPFDTDEDCKKYIEENSWDRRTEQFESILEELLR